MFVSVTIWLLLATPTPVVLPDRSGARLEESLDRLRELARRYEDSALRFTCDEKIRHYSHDGRRQYDFRYFYRRRDDGTLEDYRQATARRGPQTLEETGVPSALQRAYSWVFLFDEHHAPHYRYRYVGAGSVGRRPALGIEATPLEPFVRGISEWIATAWIARDTGELLRVDAIDVRDDENRRAYERSRQSGDDRRWSYTFEEVVTEFDVVGRGLRLPSEVRLLEVTYFQGDEKPRREHLVRQIYRNYRFFSVDARVEGERAERRSTAVEPSIP